jgi:hypothetical protein
MAQSHANPSSSKGSLINSENTGNSAFLPIQAVSSRSKIGSIIGFFGEFPGDRNREFLSW